MYFTAICTDGYEYFANRCYKLMTSAKTTASATCENGGSIDKEIDDIDAFYLRKMTSAFSIHGKGKFCCYA